MKKLWLLLALSLLLTVSGCKRQSAPPVEEERPPTAEETVEPTVPAGPLEVETLRVEISRNAADTALAVRAARELPDLLQTYFAEAQVPVNIGKVIVTVGTTPAATAQSLAQSGVDTFIEVGPGAVLQGLIAKIDKTVRVFGVSDAESLAKTIQEVKTC